MLWVVCLRAMQSFAGEELDAFETYVERGELTGLGTAQQEAATAMSAPNPTAAAGPDVAPAAALLASTTSAASGGWTCPFTAEYMQRLFARVAPSIPTSNISGAFDAIVKVRGHKGDLALFEIFPNRTFTHDWGGVFEGRLRSFEYWLGRTLQEFEIPPMKVSQRPQPMPMRSPVTTTDLRAEAIACSLPFQLITHA